MLRLQSVESHKAGGSSAELAPLSDQGAAPSSSSSRPGVLRSWFVPALSRCPPLPLPWHHLAGLPGDRLVVLLPRGNVDFVIVPGAHQAGLALDLLDVAYTQRPACVEGRVMEEGE